MTTKMTIRRYATCCGRPMDITFATLADWTGFCAQHNPVNVEADKAYFAKIEAAKFAPYRWVITTDHLEAADHDYDATGKQGPSNANPELTADPQQFQMFDDDGELYYSGILYGLADGFEPLDDFGTPNAGCTIIKINGEVL